MSQKGLSYPLCCQEGVGLAASGLVGLCTGRIAVRRFSDAYAEYRRLEPTITWS